MSLKNWINSQRKGSEKKINLDFFIKFNRSEAYKFFIKINWSEFEYKENYNFLSRGSLASSQSLLPWSTHFASFFGFKFSVKDSQKFFSFYFFEWCFLKEKNSESFFEAVSKGFLAVLILFENHHWWFQVEFSFEFSRNFSHFLHLWTNLSWKVKIPSVSLPDHESSLNKLLN